MQYFNLIKNNSWTFKEIFNNKHQIIYDDIREIYNSIQYFEIFIVPEILFNNDDYCCFNILFYVKKI